MPPPHHPTPGDFVAVQEGIKANFFARHKKDAARAKHVWASLVAKRRLLLSDTSFGPVFLPPQTPAFLRHLHVLRVIKGLPYAFRAVYVVENHPTYGIQVSIEWVGDHREYDRLFGYT